jgi:hypothetical protein
MLQSPRLLSLWIHGLSQRYDATYGQGWIDAGRQISYIFEGASGRETAHKPNILRSSLVIKSHKPRIDCTLTLIEMIERGRAVVVVADPLRCI